jgi:tripartite-type tricarboxylate transporter receptor subunit TctC
LAEHCAAPSCTTPQAISAGGVGIFAPRGTPAEIVTTLRGAIGKAAQSSEFTTALANAGQELAYLDAPDFPKVLGRRRSAHR